MSYWIQLVLVKSKDYHHQRALEELGLEEYLRQQLWRFTDEELRAHMGWPVYGLIRVPVVKQSIVAYIRSAVETVVD